MWVARGKLWLKMFWPLEVCQSKMRGWKSLFRFSVNLLDYIYCYSLKIISFSLVLLFCFDKFYLRAEFLFWQLPWFTSTFSASKQVGVCPAPLFLSVWSVMLMGLLRGGALVWAEALGSNQALDSLTCEAFPAQFLSIFDYIDHSCTSSAKILRSVADYLVDFWTPTGMRQPSVVWPPRILPSGLSIFIGVNTPTTPSPHRPQRCHFFSVFEQWATKTLCSQTRRRNLVLPWSRANGRSVFLCVFASCQVHFFHIFLEESRTERVFFLYAAVTFCTAIELQLCDFFSFLRDNFCLFLYLQIAVFLVTLYFKMCGRT